MEEQSEAAKEVAINMENTEGPYEDLVDESSTPRSDIEINEEQPKKPKVPQKNEGPATISHNNERPPDLPLKLRFLLNEDESSTPRSNQQPEGLKISKVPEMLRNLKKDEEDCFYPRVVSIGPYHHGKHHLEKFEELKTKLARQYCKTRDGVDLYKNVKGVAIKASEFYDMKILKSIKEEAFTTMMFLDGCFILEFITWLLGVKKYYHIGMNKNDIANVKRDLFLLENQLPYIVLEKLMEGHKEHEWEEMIKNFITMCRRLPPAVKPWISRKHGFQSPLHLLDMTRTRFVRQSATFPTRRGQVRDMVRHCMGIRCSPKQKATPSATSDWYSYHSVRVLKSMGIWFSPNKTGSFSDVKFESQLFIRGVLTLPPILIDASTKSLLLNLLAFESSYHNNSADNMQQGVVTSYMCFMDSLIDNAEDVMILRTQNVITNCLGNDQMVADLFNEIASNLVPNPHTYAEAKLGIQNHCNNKFKKWMAEGHHIHFRNPWTLFALFGSLFLLALTAAQTYLAAMQFKQ